MDIVWVAAEMAPFSKTGGLGDVASALPKALAKAGHRVLAVSPRHNRPPDGFEDSGVRSMAKLFGQEHVFRLLFKDEDGVRWLLVDHHSFHRRGVYGDEHGAFGDNLLRFALLTRAALDAARFVPAIDGKPLSDQVLFHANDWHTALLPLYLRYVYQPAGVLRRSRVVLGLHNLGHQGSQDASAYAGLGLPRQAWPLVDMHGRCNPLKAGVVSADALVAVSPTYAKQIQGDQGFGLGQLLYQRRRDLIGIVNGIGPEWDPATDPHLAANYSADDLSGKRACKQALQRALGLPQRDVPMLGLISRLDHQKGVDLVQAIAPWLLHHDVQLVMLGSGDPKLEGFFRASEQRWPTKARGWVGFNEALAHQIEAAADIFLMPSRFEPCGLNQLYSMRYGTVPVVHATGGLADTVTTHAPGHHDGTGWAFRPHTAEAFQRAVEYALLTQLKFPKAWAKIRSNGMNKDVSWNRSSKTYAAVYRRVLSRNAYLAS